MALLSNSFPLFSILQAVWKVLILMLFSSTFRSSFLFLHSPVPYSEDVGLSTATVLQLLIGTIVVGKGRIAAFINSTKSKNVWCRLQIKQFHPGMYNNLIPLYLVFHCDEQCCTSHRTKTFCLMLGSTQKAWRFLQGSILYVWDVCNMQKALKTVPA